MAIPYSYANLAALLAVNVSTLVDGSPRLVKNVGWFQYDSTATTGGYAPTAGAGKWFSISGAGFGSGIPIWQVKTANFTADINNQYIVDVAADVSLSLPDATGFVGGESVRIKSVGIGETKLDVSSLPSSAIGAINHFVRYQASEITYSASQSAWQFDDAFIYTRSLLAYLSSFWEFDTSRYALGDYVGGADFAGTGSAALTFTTGLVGGGVSAANFDNATAGYRLEQSESKLSIGANQIKTFTFLINIASSTELILSKKETSSANYCYKIHALNSTTIRLSVYTTGGTFNADATVTAAYGVVLAVYAEINTKANTITLQVDNTSTQGTPVVTAITGTFNAADPFVVGQETSGNQIVAVIDQIRFYSDKSLDTVQKNLLWNAGAFA